MQQNEPFIYYWIQLLIVLSSVFCLTLCLDPGFFSSYKNDPLVSTTYSSLNLYRLLLFLFCKMVFGVC